MSQAVFFHFVAPPIKQPGVMVPSSLVLRKSKFLGTLGQERVVEQCGSVHRDSEPSRLVDSMTDLSKGRIDLVVVPSELGDIRASVAFPDQELEQGVGRGLADALGKPDGFVAREGKIATGERERSSFGGPGIDGSQTASERSTNSVASSSGREYLTHACDLRRSPIVLQDAEATKAVPIYGGGQVLDPLAYDAANQPGRIPPICAAHQSEAAPAYPPTRKAASPGVLDGRLLGKARVRTAGIVHGSAVPKFLGTGCR